VGLCCIPQQTPFDVIGLPPSLVIIPPEVAVVIAISVTEVVVRTGMPAAVLKLICLL